MKKLSRSNIEEIIGVLWLILAVLLIMVHAHWLFVVVPVFMGITSQIAAIYYGYKELPNLLK